jgi:putative transposase
LKGFPEAVEAVFPQTQVQLCIVHLVRHSLFYVSHKDRKEVAADLKLIYQASTLEQADQELSNFADKWQDTYPAVVRSWQNNWTKVIPMFAFVPEIRKAILLDEHDRIAEYDFAKSH